MENSGLASENMLAAHELAAQQLPLRALVHHSGHNGFTTNTTGPEGHAATVRATPWFDGGQGPAEGGDGRATAVSVVPFVVAVVTNQPAEAVTVALTWPHWEPICAASHNRDVRRLQRVWVFRMKT